MKAFENLEESKGHKIPLPTKRGFSKGMRYGRMCYSNLLLGCSSCQRRIFRMKI